MSVTFSTTTAAEGQSLAGLCERARPALGALGDAGVPLLGVLSAVEAAGRSGGVELLADPGFALDVLAQAGPEADPALVGRVLDFLRNQTGSTAVSLTGSRPRVSVAEAVESYEAGALAVMAPGTQSQYRVWTRRLVKAHGSDDPNEITAGDLKDLIAGYVIEARLHNVNAKRDGATVEASGVGAFRHLWGYLCDKRWAAENIAQSLRKPPPGDPLRRPFRAEEAALVRHLARGLGRRDALLNEVTVCVSERLGLRRAELGRLRFCDVDLTRVELRVVHGKGNKTRVLPIPPVLAELLGRYIESRRPAGISPEDWQRSTERLLRHRPTPRFPAGRPVGVGRLNRMFKAFAEAAPQIFANGDVSHHCYRHSLASYVDARYGRAAARAVLGHRSRRSPTDHYVHIDSETVRDAICAYEQHLLAADPTVTTSETQEVDQ